MWPKKKKKGIVKAEKGKEEEEEEKEEKEYEEDKEDKEDADKSLLSYIFVNKAFNC